MIRRILIGLFAVILVALFIAPGLAEEVKQAKEVKDAKAVKHEFIGASKCKMCHKKDGVYESWLATPHATVWDKLTDEQKAKESYKKFYTTGTDAKGELLTGVQCEACHGAGGDYKKKSIMEDRELAIANGLIIPTEETCKKCHNAKATPALAKTVEGFDMKKLMATGVHAMPVKEEAKAEEKK